MIKFQDKEYVLKNFRIAKHRKDYWFQYAEITKNADDIFEWLVQKIYEGTDDADFTKVLSPLLEGDLTDIINAQKVIDNEEPLIQFTLEVVRGFLLSSKA